MSSRAYRPSVLRAPISAGLTVRGRPLALVVGIAILLGLYLGEISIAALDVAGHPVPFAPPVGKIDPSRFVVFTLFAILFIVGACLFIWWGARWARILMILLTILSTVAFVYHVATRHVDLFSAIDALLGALAMVLLFLPAVNAWMRVGPPELRRSR